MAAAIKYKIREDGEHVAWVTLAGVAFCGVGKTKEDARVDLANEAERLADEVRAWLATEGE